MQHFWFYVQWSITFAPCCFTYKPLSLGAFPSERSQWRWRKSLRTLLEKMSNQSCVAVLTEMVKSLEKMNHHSLSTAIQCIKVILEKMPFLIDEAQTLAWNLKFIENIAIMWSNHNHAGGKLKYTRASLGVSTFQILVTIILIQLEIRFYL